MNKKIAQFMKCECEDNTPFHHIHATGSFGWRWMPDYVREQGVDLAAQPRIEMREYIYDMPQVLAAADLIICRAGALTVAEVAAAGLPAIFVPLPHGNGEQARNADFLIEVGAGVLVPDQELDGDRVVREVSRLFADPEALASMSQTCRKLVPADASVELARLVIRAAQS